MVDRERILAAQEACRLAAEKAYHDEVNKYAGAWWLDGLIPEDEPSRSPAKHWSSWTGCGRPQRRRWRCTATRPSSITVRHRPRRHQRRVRNVSHEPGLFDSSGGSRWLSSVRNKPGAPSSNSPNVDAR